MSDQLRLEVVTPQRRILQIEVDEVRLPGSLGELGVLPGHTPLLTTLGIGPLTIFSRAGEQKMAIFGGFAEVLPHLVTVLAQGAETAAEIDVVQARRERDEAEAELKTAGAEEIDDATRRLRSAATRLLVAGDVAD